ncbi:MAG: polymer-forming cytoskeletal protein [Candidatus Hydrogenedentota bacterium]
MSDKKQANNDQARIDLDAEARESYQKLNKAGRKGLFGKFSDRLNDAITSSRGPERESDAAAESAGQPQVTADHLAMRRARTVKAQSMTIPEGVIVEGNLSGATDTEIAGRVDGDVTVEGRLYLGKSALVSGNVRATGAKIEGLVEGKVECSEWLELYETGRLNADVVAGKRINLAGQVYGNVTTPGVLHMLGSCKVNGDIKVRNLHMDEGAALNGACIMRAPSQRGASSQQGGA